MPKVTSNLSSFSYSAPVNGQGGLQRCLTLAKKKKKKNPEFNHISVRDPPAQPSQISVAHSGMIVHSHRHPDTALRWRLLWEVCAPVEVTPVCGAEKEAMPWNPPWRGGCHSRSKGLHVSVNAAIR